MQSNLRGLTILGTDTEVGKTYVACRVLEDLVAKGIKVAAYKPVASGASSLEESDGYRLWLASGKRGSLHDVAPQSFRAPLAPPIAARLEGKTVDEERIWQGALHWRGNCDYLLMEGAGGLMSPISWTMTNAILASRIGFPILLVASNRLGVVNQVLTTIEAARALNLNIQGVVLNDTGGDLSLESNQELLDAFLKQAADPPEVVRLRWGGTKFDPPLKDLDLDV